MTLTDTENPTTTDDAGEVPAPTGGRRLDVVALWCSEASRERMNEGFECDVADELDKVGSADLVVISTRVPRVRVRRVMDRLAREASGPIVVVCHAGGEGAATELMELGASSVVAEGNERTLANLVGGAVRIEPSDPDVIVNDETLLTTFSHHLDATTSGSVRARGTDPVTGLATSSSFELRMADQGQRSAVPRLGFIRVANAHATTAGLDRETADLLRRRLCMLFAAVTNRFEAELFGIDDFELAFMGPRLSPRRADELGEHILAIGESFMPQGHEQIRLAVGHAGSEVAADIRTLRDLATRAVEAAVTNGGGVVSADDLTRLQAGTTELAAALRVAARVDDLDPNTDHHAELVVDYAVEIAGELGLDGHDLIQLRLACQLHDIGKIGLDASAGPDTPEHRSHPERGERYVKASAGTAVALAIRHHHERWDGRGFPDGLAGDDIPVAARIIAVADAVDRWSGDEAGDGLSTHLREGIGTLYDESIVDAALALFGG